MFDWEDLRHFSALAREGSLSAAARKLGVDHATVARRIAALEASLALKLVDRRPRSYVLSPDGARIAALAASMEEQAFAIGRAARAVGPGLTGEVTISAPPALSSALVAPRLGELRALHPQLHVRLLGEKRLASLSQREADVALRLSRPTEKKLVARKLGAFAYGFYASRGYAAECPAEAYEFIAYDESLEASPQQQWLKAVAGERPIVLRMSELEGQRAAARAGVGIAALPRFLGDADPELVSLELGGKPVTRDVWLVVHSDLSRSPVVRAVMKFLVDCLA